MISRKLGTVLMTAALTLTGLAVADVATAKPKPIPSHGIIAPKGRPALNAGKGVTSKALTDCTAMPNGACMYYSTKNQVFSTGTEPTGYSFTTTVSNPYLATSTNNGMGQADAHTLVEGTVQDSTGNIIEVGWTKSDEGVCATASQPCLFVASWDSSGFNGYNGGGGWTDNGAVGVNAGDSLSTAVGTNKAFGIAHNAASSRWDVSYNGSVIGWFPDATFGGTLVNVPALQVFGELAALNAESCSDMGSGAHAGTSPSTVISGLTLTGTATAASFANAALTDNNYWARTDVSATSFRLGGEGRASTETVTTVGTRDHCAPNAEGTPAASSFQFWQEECPDNAATTGCTNAINFTWSSMTVGTCVPYTLARNLTDIWNNAGSSGKVIAAYDGGADNTGCDGTSAQWGNAVKAKLPAALRDRNVVAFKRIS